MKKAFEAFEQDCCPVCKVIYSTTSLFGGVVPGDNLDTMKLFVSYCHKDKVWLDRLRTHLEPLTRNGLFNVFSDRQIAPGRDWRNEIEQALGLADAAILLVTADFLASQFVVANELPPLLARAQENGVRILWLAVSASLYNREAFARYQAANDPARPLDSLRKADREAELARVAALIADVLTRQLPEHSEPQPRAYDRSTALHDAIRHCDRGEPLLRGNKYQRNDLVTTDGDIRIVEVRENLVPYGADSISRIPVGFRSRAGRQSNWKCESLKDNQSVEWIWHEANAGVSDGIFVFDPPITPQNPVSFRTERYVLNGVSFTQSERQEATRGKGAEEAEEEFRVIYRHIYKTTAFQIRFPLHHFPNTFKLDVFNQNGTRSPDECGFARDFLNIFPETQNIVFNMQQPLPGYQYAIRWELPEGSPSRLTDAEQGFTDEISRRLLGLRAGAIAPSPLIDALDRCRLGFLKLAGTGCIDTVALVVYVYDRQKSGLVCVASVAAEDIEKNWPRYFFKPGRGVVGTAFRKRAVEIYSRGREDPDRFEVLSGESVELLPKLVVCVPLFYHGYLDRAMAMLSFEARDPSPELLGFCHDSNAAARIATEFERWYESGLAHAIGTQPTDSFWRRDSASVYTK